MPWLRGPLPRRVLLVADPGDGHHVEICFLRFFARLRESLPFDWELRTYRDGTASVDATFDLVILCRPRFPEGLSVLDSANALGLSAMAMIDDNWPAAGREYARYRDLFSPGRPALDAFLDCIRRADVTLVYNGTLARELEPIARRLELLPTNVDLSLFSARTPIDREGGRLLVGYAGSPRFESSAFEALAELVRRRPAVDLLLMGHELPSPLESVPSRRLQFVPFVRGYPEYASQLATLAPDVLVAPLEDNVFSASKCPNKFLEITAVHAAGVYSRVEPYVSVVDDGRTGLLVANRTTDWLIALERLVDDSTLRRAIAAKSMDRVSRDFSTSAVQPQFEAVLRRATQYRARR